LKLPPAEIIRIETIMVQWQDRQGPSFFELLDGEGNTVEISEKP